MSDNIASASASETYPRSEGEKVGGVMDPQSAKAFRAWPPVPPETLRNALLGDGPIIFEGIAEAGSVFVPAKYDPVSGHMIQDHDATYLTQPYWGDWAFCNAIPGSENLFKCLAIYHDVVVDLATTHRVKGRPA